MVLFRSRQKRHRLILDAPRFSIQLTKVLPIPESLLKVVSVIENKYSIESLLQN